LRDAPPLPLREWQFVAFTLDGTTLSLYCNGCALTHTAAPASFIFFVP
jgi:hypothetical protein